MKSAPGKGIPERWSSGGEPALFVIYGFDVVLPGFSTSRIATRHNDLDLKCFLGGII
jgi:hypothetical protein